MDLLGGYGTDSSEDETTKTTTEPSVDNNNNTVKHNAEFKQISTFKPNLTPFTNSIRVMENKIDPRSKSLVYNPTFDNMSGDVEGPQKPFLHSKNKMDPTIKNHVNGVIENYYMNDYSFSEQYYSFKSKGFAANPDIPDGIVSNINNNESTTELYSNNNNNNNNEKKKGKRVYEDPANVSNYKGTWGTPREPTASAIAAEDSTTMTTTNTTGELTEEQKSYMESRVKTKKSKSELPDITSVFHGKAQKDYMGRSWIEPPSDLRTDIVPSAFLPKKLVHTWSGHTKAVSAIRLYPKTGHLLLSSSMDNTVKIWDVHNDRRCLQTYTGHSQAVRDISFSNDGRRFLSCGYDRVTRLWDTETGKIIGSFTNGKIPYVAKFNPDEDKQNLFVVGGSDKKIIQWDINANEIVQEYNQHLGAINTITFIDDNRRFVSSSDDKSLRIWEWGIPVVIKYVSEPDMHSMPAVSVHPKGKWFATQSLDNQILIYSTRDKFRMNKKKRFIGHTVAGYACQLGFSPDGKYVISGDSTGKAYFWDWKSSKVYKTLSAHDGVCIGIEWHPIETSKVVTCGWDGKIKFWD
eukprot:gene10667-13065_t